MKVYIVVETSWEYSTIRAVCSLEELAIEYMAKADCPTDATLNIEEWFIDE